MHPITAVVATAVSTRSTQLPLSCNGQLRAVQGVMEVMVVVKMTIKGPVMGDHR
jgi:hypothetical protein